MGRGVGDNNGEIALLDADRITDHSDRAAPENREDGFGNEADDRAISRIKARLKDAPSSRGLDLDAIEDRAIDLYNHSCQLIQSGRSSEEQIAKISELFGEDPDVLVARLRMESSTEELAGDSKSGGAGGLLRALGGN